MQDVILKLESIHDDRRDKYWNHLQGRVRMGNGEIKGAKGLMGDRPFVREVIGVDHAGQPVKKDLRGRKSYDEAPGAGRRGVCYWFTLKQGRCYQVQEQVSNRRTRKYYVIVNEGHTFEVDEEAAIFFAGHGHMESVICL